MRDLVREAGLPASTLRFYVKEGLLPAPERPSVNSAVYGEAHLKAARALKRIRALNPRLALAPLKRAIALVTEGVEPEVALMLADSVFASGVAQTGTGPFDKKTLAKRAGVKPTVIDEICAVGVIVPIVIGGQPLFDDLDAELVRRLLALRSIAPDVIAASGAIARHIAEASRLEIEMRNRMTRRLPAQQAAAISGAMQEAANIWHAYLFSRLRVREIAEHGLGNEDRS